jgi:hypothetical protein
MLILWTMAASDAVKTLINQSYKQNRHDDDLNQPRSVQPWGTDGDKRRYFLVEGLDDTNFRVYRESNPAGANRTWWSVAGSIDEIKALADKLDLKDGGPKARKLSHMMLQAIPRFEAGDEVSHTEYPKTLRPFLTSPLETQTQRVPPAAEGSLQTTGTWVLDVRGSHKGQAHKVHIF